MAEIASAKLVGEFGAENWLEIDRQLDSGEISFYECVKQQYSALSGSQDEMRKFCRDELQLRNGFKEFVSFCNNKNYQIHIVAEALDFMIEEMLERDGISGLKIFSDRAVFTQSEPIQIEFPNFADDCVCGLGNCKGGHVRVNREFYSTSVFIGDGSNDYCGAKESNLIFARRELARICTNEEIEYIPFEDFYQVLNSLQNLGF